MYSIVIGYINPRFKFKYSLSILGFHLKVMGRCSVSLTCGLASTIMQELDQTKLLIYHLHSNL